MAEFKQMTKMKTTEPSVILKLKKGGHVSVEHKDADGHTNMKGKAFLSARAEESEEGASPKKPSIAERSKAMAGAKPVKKAVGGPLATPGAVDPKRAAVLRALMAKRNAAPVAPTGGLPALKKGGASKKHFATGGSVDDAGQAVAMPEKPASKPISTTAQAGTFKKGGKVQKFAEGDRVEDLSKGAYDATIRDKGSEDMPLAQTIRNAPSAAFAAMKRLLGVGGEDKKAAALPVAKKRGGSAKR